MNDWPLVALDELFGIARGGSPRPIDAYITDAPQGVNWILIGDASSDSKYITSTKKRIREEGARRSRFVHPGDFLLTNSMSFGKPYIMGTSGCIHDGWLVLTKKRNNVDADFFYHLLGSNAVYMEFKRLAAGATVKNLNIDLVKAVKIPLPPLEEQRRIAAILDKADALRQKRRLALQKLGSLTQSIFLDMFGDPALNLKRFPTMRLGNLASRFSDGPFGSNLKSEHYVERGVRVIRLQNIGINEFLDGDKAYISEDHASSLEKHQCYPGDVLVGTLGDPNLRACIQPDWIPRAINKADCVQVRAKEGVSTAEFLASLLNLPSVEKMASGLIQGQTRSRIAMGRLRELVVPAPPVAKQLEFSANCKRSWALRMKAADELQRIDALFASIQHRAFREEL